MEMEGTLYMRRSDRQIHKMLSTDFYLPHGGGGLQKALGISRQAFYENETADTLSDAEFLFQQSRYIRKRWWLLQAGVLMALWLLLRATASGFYIQRYLGVAASLFGILVLPEMWKNRSANDRGRRLLFPAAGVFGQDVPVRSGGFCAALLLFSGSSPGRCHRHGGGAGAVFSPVHCDLLYLL